jgi:hypothetical protein
MPIKLRYLAYRFIKSISALHNKIISVVMRATVIYLLNINLLYIYKIKVLFFDQTPTGRLVNRFANDFNI